MGSARCDQSIGREGLDLSLLVLVSFGGAVGAIARFLLTEAFPEPADAFPWTTFTINVTGCLALALLPAFVVVRRSRHLPVLLGSGLLGGFTTMSAYAEQTRRLLESGSTAMAVGYLGGTLAAGLVAVALVTPLATVRARAAFAEEDGDL